jgi:hypothetical protein
LNSGTIAWHAGGPRRHFARRSFQRERRRCHLFIRI